jgi:hypothetical protein
VAIKIKLKNSVVANKAPLPTDLDIGEVAINANAASPAAYIKDSAGAVVKLAGVGSVSTPDATTAAKGVVQLADAAAVTAGTAGRVVDAAQLKAVSDADDWTRTGTEISPKTAGDSVFTTGAVKVGGTTAAPNLQIKADGGIVANTDGLFYDAATKRLGIGTASPSRLFTVSDVNPVAAIRSTTTTGQCVLTFGDSDGDSRGIVSYENNGDALSFWTAGGEKARIDSSGRLLVGTSSSRSVATQQSMLQIEGTSFSTTNLSICRNSNDVYGPYVHFGKSRGTTVGSSAIVASGDDLGGLVFGGADGSTVNSNAAYILCQVDGTPGANDMPGRLVFSTTADGASSPTPRMRINNGGGVRIGDDENPAYLFDVKKEVASNYLARFFNTRGASDVGGHVLYLDANRSDTANTRLIDTKDSKWILYSNGTTGGTSDTRLKKNIETTRDGYLEDVNLLRVVKYQWKTQGDNEPKELGLIAQEVEQVFPGLVQEVGIQEGEAEQPSSIKTIKTSVFIPILIKALQEASVKIETLEAKVAALEGA